MKIILISNISKDYILIKSLNRHFTVLYYTVAVLFSNFSFLFHLIFIRHFLYTLTHTHTHCSLVMPHILLVTHKREGVMWPSSVRPVRIWYEISLLFQFLVFMAKMSLTIRDRRYGYLDHVTEPSSPRDL